MTTDRDPTALLRADLIAWGAENGVPLRRVPKADSLAAEFSPDRRQGNLSLPHWTIRAVSNRAMPDAREAVRRVERDRADNGDTFGAAIIRSRTTRDPDGDSLEHAYVVLSIDVWREVVHALARPKFGAGDSSI